MPEQLNEGKRRSTGSRGIDEMENLSFWTMKVEECENLRGIFYVY